MRWTKEKVINGIKELSKNGVAPRTKDDDNLHKAGARLFGSWEAACEIAGVDMYANTRSVTQGRNLKKAKARDKQKWSLLCKVIELSLPQVEQGKVSLREAVDRCLVATRGYVSEVSVRGMR